MIYTVLLIVWAVFLFYRYLRHHYAMFLRDGVPGPRPSFFIGNLAEFADKDSLGTFYRLSKQYGKVFGYYEGFTPSIVVSDPAMFELILVKHFRQFHHRPKILPFEQGAESLSLHALNGPAWKRARSVIAGGLRTVSLRKMWPRLQTAVTHYMDGLERMMNDNSDGLDVSVPNADYALWSFTSAVFNRDRESFTAEDAAILYHYVQANEKTSSPENPAYVACRLCPPIAPFLKIFDTFHRQKAIEFFDLISRNLHSEHIELGESKTPKSFLQHCLVTRTICRGGLKNQATDVTPTPTINNSNNTTIANDNNIDTKTATNTIADTTTERNTATMTTTEAAASTSTSTVYTSNSTTTTNNSTQTVTSPTAGNITTNTDSNNTTTTTTAATAIPTPTYTSNSTTTTNNTKTVTSIISTATTNNDNITTATTADANTTASTTTNNNSTKTVTTTNNDNITTVTTAGANTTASTTTTNSTKTVTTTTSDNNTNKDENATNDSTTTTAKRGRAGKASSSSSSTLTEPEVLGVLSSLFGGGLGPTATTLDFALYCLALHPEEQEKLREEVVAVCGDQDPLEMNHIRSMEYLDMFVCETFRHYPVAPGVARTCVEDCVLKGVQFRKGTVVRLMSSTQYRDPEVFPDPERFIPERFSQEERKKRHTYSFIPFGSGPRMCVAKQLGQLQAKLALASVVRRFRVRSCARTQTPLPLAFRPFLCPRDGVRIRLEPRDEAA